LVSLLKYLKNYSPLSGISPFPVDEAIITHIFNPSDFSNEKELFYFVEELD
jgi:hypothetical protein